MARVAQRASAATAAAPGGGGDLGGDQEDKCPNCRNSRYLNPNLTFLMSPLCYHKMCSTCVDRIFGAGPAECPIAGCHKVLRRTEFRKQTFADAAIEREVDIRRRVDAVLGGRSEDDFEDLLAWNDYLEQVETVAFELTNRIDEETNWTKLRALEAEKKKKSKLSSDKGNTLQIKRAKQAAAPTRSSTGTPVPAGAPDGTGALNGSSTGFVIRGLKKREDSKAVAGGAGSDAFDPYGGLRYHPQYYIPLDHYDAGFLDTYRADEKQMAGGFDMHGYCLRSLNDAFAGLGVFIDDEKMADADANGSDNAETTQSLPAPVASKPKKKATAADDDVF